MKNWDKRFTRRYRSNARRPLGKISIPWQIIVSIKLFSEETSDEEIASYFDKVLSKPIEFEKDLFRKLVTYFYSDKQTEIDSSLAAMLFNCMCKHPSGTDLVSWPELTPFGPDELTVDQIVDICSKDWDQFEE